MALTIKEENWTGSDTQTMPSKLSLFLSLQILSLCWLLSLIPLHDKEDAPVSSSRVPSFWAYTSKRKTSPSQLENEMSQEMTLTGSSSICHSSTPKLLGVVKRWGMVVSEVKDRAVCNWRGGESHLKTLSEPQSMREEPFPKGKKIPLPERKKQC